MFDITEDHMDQVISNAKTGTEIPVDYHHLSLGAILPEQTIAGGWFKDFERRATNLFGLVEWTEKAADHIRKKELRYISPTILFDTSDEQGNPVGASLLSAALTNYPFLKGMQAVELTSLMRQEIVLADMSFDEKRSRLSEALNKSYGNDSDYVFLQDLFDDYVVFQKGGKKYRVDYTADEQFNFKFVGDAVEVVVQYEALSINPGADMSGQNTNTDITKDPAYIALTTRNDELAQNMVQLSAQVAAMKTASEQAAADAAAEKERANRLELQLNTEHANKAVDALIRAKKLKVGDKEKWTKLYLKDRENFVELSATLQSAELVLGQEHGTAGGDVSEGEPASNKNAVALFSEKIEEIKTRDNLKYGDAYRRASDEYPELARDYRASFGGRPTTVQ